MSFSTYSAFRLGIADDVNATESHSFKELMKDKKDVISDGNEKFSESWLLSPANVVSLFPDGGAYCRLCDSYFMRRLMFVPARHAQYPPTQAVSL